MPSNLHPWFVCNCWRVRFWHKTISVGLQHGITLGSVSELEAWLAGSESADDANAAGLTPDPQAKAKARTAEV